MKWLQQFLTLARFDLRTQLRERGNIIMLAAVILIALFGLWQGNQFHQTAVDFSFRAQLQERTAMEKAEAFAMDFFANPDDAKFRDYRSFRNPADVRGYAYREHISFAVKPVIVGAPLAIAQADVLPSYVRVKAESMDSVRNSNEIEHPKRLAVGRFDLLFVVMYLWPLALLALTVSALTEEREAGRLRTLQLQNIGAGLLLSAQVSARSLLLIALFGFAVGIAAFAFGALPLSSAGFGAFMSWFGVFALYSLFWACVAAAIAAVCANRATALFAAFGAWLSLTILLPALLGAMVNVVTPMPSREGYLLDVRQAGDKINSDRVKMAERFYDMHPEWRPATMPVDKVPAAVMRLARAAEMERVLSATEARFQTAKAAQATLFARFSPLSPVTIAQSAFAELSGNDGARHDQFINEVRQYQLQLRDFFQARIQAAALIDEATPCKHVTGTCKPGFGFTEHRSVPKFSASTALTAAPVFSLSVWWLLAWAILLAVATVLVLRPTVQTSTNPQSPLAQ